MSENIFINRENIDLSPIEKAIQGKTSLPGHPPNKRKTQEEEEKVVLSSFERVNILRKLELAAAELSSVRSLNLNLSALKKNDAALMEAWENVKKLFTMNHPMQSHLQIFDQVTDFGEKLLAKSQSFFLVEGLAENIKKNTTVRDNVKAYSLINFDCSEGTILWNLLTAVGGEALKTHALNTEMGRQIKQTLDKHVPQEILKTFADL